ncbi:MAG: hypothetical protein GDA52_06060 [Rhodobacteraceae bacterium]|nr:hypothetical protein [Paracoccaceae bacterium]
MPENTVEFGKVPEENGLALIDGVIVHPFHDSGRWRDAEDTAVRRCGLWLLTKPDILFLLTRFHLMGAFLLSTLMLRVLWILNRRLNVCLAKWMKAS